VLGQHSERIAQLVADLDNAALQKGNEPDHSTQRPEVADPAWGNANLEAAIPWTYGAAHGADDENLTWAKASDTYGVVHGDRADGDRGWRWVRHTKEQLHVSEETGLYINNGEPRRDDLMRVKHLALGALCRLLNLGDTFHYSGGRYAEYPTAEELDCLVSRREGWNLMPSDFFGRFQNANNQWNWPDSPVQNFDTNDSIRVYTSEAGGVAFSLVIGSYGNPRIEWRDDVTVMDEQKWGNKLDGNEVRWIRTES
jgi:hypothetical protein